MVLRSPVPGDSETAVQRRHPISVLALACALGPAALLAAGDVERDDPRERARAMEDLRGDLSPSGSLRILQEARRERDRYGPRGGFRAFQAVQGSTFVNVGP